MNAFEQVIAALMEREGYWVRPSYKVSLSKAQKVAIGKPSCPRWELDLVAYKAATNDLRVVECKSYLDSPGVRLRDFNGTGAHGASRYKLFNDETLRSAILSEMASQLVRDGSCLPNPAVTLCLAAGKIAGEADAIALRSMFDSNGWQLLGPDWIATRLHRTAADGYENSVTSIVAKLLA